MLQSELIVNILGIWHDSQKTSNLPDSVHCDHPITISIHTTVSLALPCMATLKTNDRLVDKEEALVEDLSIYLSRYKKYMSL